MADSDIHSVTSTVTADENGLEAALADELDAALAASRAARPGADDVMPAGEETLGDKDDAPADEVAAGGGTPVTETEKKGDTAGAMGPPAKKPRKKTAEEKLKEAEAKAALKASKAAEQAAKKAEKEAEKAAKKASKEAGADAKTGSSGKRKATSSEAPPPKKTVAQLLKARKDDAATKEGDEPPADSEPVASDGADGEPAASDEPAAPPALPPAHLDPAKASASSMDACLVRGMEKEEAADMVKCRYCGRENPPAQMRLMSKTSWRCSGCNTQLVRLARMFGSWPLRQFSQLSEGEKSAFYLEITSSKKSGHDIVETLTNSLTIKEVSEKRVSAKGKFLPLKVWEGQGYDPSAIAAEADDADHFFDRKVGAEVYRVDVLEVSRSQITQHIRQELLEIVSSAGKRNKGVTDVGATPVEDSPAAAGSSTSASPQDIKQQEKDAMKAEKKTRAENLRKAREALKGILSPTSMLEGFLNNSSVAKLPKELKKPHLHSALSRIYKNNARTQRSADPLQFEGNLVKSAPPRPG